MRVLGICDRRFVKIEIYLVIFSLFNNARLHLVYVCFRHVFDFAEVLSNAFVGLINGFGIELEASPKYVYGSFGWIGLLILGHR